MRADKQMQIDLKNIESIVHDGQLKDENAKIRAQQVISKLLMELVALEAEDLRVPAFRDPKRVRCAVPRVSTRCVCDV